MFKFAALFPTLLLCGCALFNPVPTQSGIHTEWMDPTVRPQDDLYGYTNGKWLATAVIPPDRARFGAFDQLRDQSESTLHEILEGLSRAPQLESGSESQKLSDLYTSFMDEERLTRLGVGPVAATLEQIERCATVDDVVRLFAQLGRGEASVPMAGYVSQDARDTDRYTVYITQSGLGLPDRDYYLDTGNARLEGFRKAYVAYLTELFSRAARPNPESSAKQVLALETKLAALQWSKVQNRDAVKTYNRFLVADLSAQLAPNFPWQAWMEAASLVNRTDSVVVRQPDYLKGLGDLLHSQSLDAWKVYLTARVLDGMAPYLGRELENIHFQFHSKTLRGIPENRPRWKRAVATVEGALGEALGQRYVDLKFSWQQKARMEDMVEHLLAAYDADLQTLPWMEASTREAALKKLHALRVKIGYPDVWRDYSALQIVPGDLVGNLVRADEFEYQRNLGKLGGPIDRTEWHMTPQTVNAYYDGNANEIVFPAAILQPPFFDFAADDAVNYGAIGAVIGHEISHGFDDQGSRHDAQGNLNNWWTDNDRNHFEQLTQRLVQQYSGFNPLPGYAVNGELTLGENIADNSGLAIAWKAWKLSLGEGGSPVIEGFTGAQRFYLGWAQVWRNQVREAEIIRLLKVDPHSPGSVRANGTVVNQPGFEEAFGLKPGDALYRTTENQVIIW